MNKHMISRPESGAGGDVARTVLPRCIDVGEVLADQREIVLMHNGEAYRLRITANNKLILTK